MIDINVINQFLKYKGFLPTERSIISFGRDGLIYCHFEELNVYMNNIMNGVMSHSELQYFFREFLLYHFPNIGEYEIIFVAWIGNKSTMDRKLKDYTSLNILTKDIFNEK